MLKQTYSDLQGLLDMESKLQKKANNVDCRFEENSQSVLLPPDSIVDIPPIETRLQDLPVEKLTWENFERLCLRLSGKNAEAESWQCYGRKGQAQEGIDIFVRRKDEQYDLWQCKRYQKFTAAKIKDAVDVFLQGKWKDRANSLILSVTVELNDTTIQDEIEKQAKRLKEENGITFCVYGKERLSEALKPYPDLVDDFFGRTWVESFCGDDALSVLGNIRQKLDGKKYLELRKELYLFYKIYFETLDRGLMGATNLPSGVNTAPELLERFIIPDVIVKEASFTSYRPVEQPVSKQVEPNRHYQDQNSQPQDNRQPRNEVVEQIQRISLQKWLTDGNKAAILGDAGSGKSTLLRCIALDLLSNQLVFPELSKEWSNFIPIIVPFARWTRAIAENPAGISLEEMICNWLKTFSISETLIELIKLALEDRRLLLLIDGLDEWSNETAARTALDQLETVIKTHDVAAILTGRPLGVSKLGGLGHPWRTTELASLSATQQHQLAEIWFKNAQQSQKDELTKHDLIKWQIDNFFKDLQDGGQLQNLAGTPLLLTGLISLRVRQVNLPRNRFRVYEDLTKLLLERHPQARLSAASTIQPRFKVLSDFDDRQKALGKLAYEIRNIGADSGLSKREAKTILVKFLKDDNFLGLSPERAREGAQEILAVNAETSGILIEKSPDEVGFIHAVFEEYLSATHLSSFSLEEQLVLVSKNCSDPRWRNVILSLFHQLSRPQEIDALIAEIEKADVDIIGDFFRWQLLAEAAFGDKRCTPKTAKRIAQEVFNKIDFGYWMPERRALLKYALSDGAGGSLQELQKERLTRWYPETQWSRESLFNVLASWEKSDDLQEVLWRGLFDTERRNRRSAAQALAKVFRGDEKIKTKLLIAIKAPYEPEITATLLFAITQGWSESNELKRFIDIARVSESNDLKREGIFAAIELGIQTEQDRDTLLDLSHRSISSYEFQEQIVDAFIKGWSRDAVILEACLKAWSREDAIDYDIAQKILLLGYASEQRVVDYLCQLLTSEERRVFGADEPWDAITKSFTKHPAVSIAIDKYIAHLAQDSFNEREIALAAQVSKSNQAKKTLLNLLEQYTGSFPHWAVWGLLEGWGMDDIEVRNGLLNKINENNLMYLGAIARFLPEIIEDKAICRNKFLEIAQQENIRWADLLVRGFASLGVKNTDNEVMDLLLPLAKKADSLGDPTLALIRAFPQENRIKKLAFDLIGRHAVFLATIAESYSNDIEIRNAVLNRATPLPSILRQDIVLYAERRCDESPEFHHVLLEYKNEHDAAVRTSAEAAYYSALKRRGEINEKIDQTLTEELYSVGSHYDTLRQSAFAGVIGAGRLEMLKNLKSLDGEKPLSIPVLSGYGYRENTVLVEMAASHWDEISAEFGTEILNRLEGGDSGKWESLTPYLNESSTLQKEFIDYCKTTEKHLTANSLLALSKLKLELPLLKKHCLRIIENSNPEQHKIYSLDDVLSNQTAGKILGTIFADNIELEPFFCSHLNKNPEGAIIGLSLAFSTNAELKAIYSTLAETKQFSNYSWVAALYIMSTCGDDDFFERVVNRRISLSNSKHWGFHSNCVEPIVSRLAKNQETYNRFFNRLTQGESSANELASIPRLLALSSSGDENLYDWCKQEIERQTNKELPDNGYDLIAGRVRPILHSLFDILIAYGFSSIGK